MLAMHEKYIVNDRGRKTAVVLPLKDWEAIQEMLEDLDDIRAFDAAMSKPSEPIPWDDAIKELRK